MSIILEVPEQINKADQILGLMDAQVVVGELSWPPPSLRVYVCVIQLRNLHKPLPEGHSLEVARILRTEEEFNAQRWAGDANYRVWLSVPMGRVLEQHPQLDIAQASPATKMKRKVTA